MEVIHQNHDEIVASYTVPPIFYYIFLWYRRNFSRFSCINCPTISYTSNRVVELYTIRCPWAAMWLPPNSSGDTIQLGLVRISTSSPSRLGTLIYNPGGPGDKASDYLFGVEDGLPNFSATLLEAYDIIGIDPRGVGLSEPIQCDPEIYNERVSLFPKTDAGFQELLRHNERLGKSCLELSGSLLHHLDTINVAKDMDAFDLLSEKREIEFPR